MTEMMIASIPRLQCFTPRACFQRSARFHVYPEEGSAVLAHPALYTKLTPEEEIETRSLVSALRGVSDLLDTQLEPFCLRDNQKTLRPVFLKDLSCPMFLQRREKGRANAAALIAVRKLPNSLI